jgi:hypothetical protein
VARITGGPFDGADWDWEDVPVACGYVPGTRRLAVYVRQPDGSYLYEKTVHEDELEEADG